MIKIVEGNILDAKEDIIGHQVNCLGIMGSKTNMKNLASQIRNRYPKVYFEYKEFVDNVNDKNDLLGVLQLISIAEWKHVANLFGQLNIGRDKRQTNYTALKTSLVKLKDFAKSLNYSVALPENLGCGLAGGDWKVVYKIIEDVFSDYEVTLYKFK